MQVRCMASGTANRGVITKEECLNCALASGTNTPCGYDYILLKYIYSKERYEEDKIHVSDILGCARQAYFAKKFKLPVDAHKDLVVTFGTLQHQMLEEMQDDNYEAEKQMNSNGVVGTTDVYYKNGRIVDWKTTRGINKKYLPQKKHKLQVNIYAHMLKELGYDVKEAAIQYVDFLGPSKCDECKAYVVAGDVFPKCPICGREDKDWHMGAYLVNVPLMESSEVEEMIKNGVDYLQECLDTETIPEPSPDFLCRYCKYVNFCEEGQKML